MAASGGMSDDYELLDLQHEVLSLGSEGSEGSDGNDTDGGTAVIEAMEEGPQPNHLQGMFLGSLPHFPYPGLLFGHSPPATGLRFSLDVLSNSSPDRGEAPKAAAAAAAAAPPPSAAATQELPAHQRAASAPVAAAGPGATAAAAPAPGPGDHPGASSDSSAAWECPTDDYEEVAQHGASGEAVLQQHDEEGLGQAKGRGAPPRPAKDAAKQEEQAAKDDDEDKEEEKEEEPAAAAAATNTDTDTSSGPQQHPLLLAGALLASAALAVLLLLLLLGAAAGTVGTSNGRGQARFAATLPGGQTPLPAEGFAPRSGSILGGSGRVRMTTPLGMNQPAPPPTQHPPMQPPPRLQPLLLTPWWRALNLTRGTLTRRQAGTPQGAGTMPSPWGSASDGSAHLLASPHLSQLSPQLQAVARGSSKARLSGPQRLRLQLWLLHLAQQEQHLQHQQQQQHSRCRRLGRHHSEQPQEQQQHTLQAAAPQAPTCNTTTASDGPWWLATPAATAAAVAAGNAKVSLSSSVAAAAPLQGSGWPVPPEGAVCANPSTARDWSGFGAAAVAPRSSTPGLRAPQATGGRIMVVGQGANATRVWIVLFRGSTVPAAASWARWLNCTAHYARLACSCVRHAWRCAGAGIDSSSGSNASRSQTSTTTTTTTTAHRASGSHVRSTTTATTRTTERVQQLWLLLGQIASNTTAGSMCAVQTCAAPARASIAMTKTKTMTSFAPAARGSGSSSGTCKRLATDGAAAAAAAATTSNGACEAPMWQPSRLAVAATVPAAAAAPASPLRTPTPPPLSAANVAARPRFIAVRPTQQIPPLYRPPLPCLLLGGRPLGAATPPLKEAAAAAGQGETPRAAGAGAGAHAIFATAAIAPWSHATVSARHHQGVPSRPTPPAPAAASAAAAAAATSANRPYASPAAAMGAVGRWLLQQLPAGAMDLALTLPWLPLLPNSLAVNGSTTTNANTQQLSGASLGLGGRQGGSGRSLSRLQPSPATGAAPLMLPAVASAQKKPHSSSTSSAITLPMLPPVVSGASSCSSSRQLQPWKAQTDAWRAAGKSTNNAVAAEAAVAAVAAATTDATQPAIQPYSPAGLKQQQQQGVALGSCAVWEEHFHLPHRPPRKLLAEQQQQQQHQQLHHDHPQASGSATCSSSGSGGSLLLVHRLVPLTAAAAAGGSHQEHHHQQQHQQVQGGGMMTNVAVIRHQLGLTWQQYEDEDDYTDLNELPTYDVTHDASGATCGTTGAGILQDAHTPRSLPGLVTPPSTKASPMTTPSAAPGGKAAVAGAAAAARSCTNNATFAAAVAAAARLAAAGREVDAFMGRRISGSRTPLPATAAKPAATAAPPRYQHPRCINSSSSPLQPLLHAAAPVGARALLALSASPATGAAAAGAAVGGAKASPALVPAAEWVASFVSLPVLPPNEEPPPADGCSSGADFVRLLGGGLDAPGNGSEARAPSGLRGGEGAKVALWRGGDGAVV